jgi:protein-tyrosine phosphatase
MDRIEPGLFLGDVHDASDHAALRDADVDAVLSLSHGDPETPFPDAVSVVRIPLIDGPQNEFEDFRAAAAELRDLLRSDQTVFVHCAAGVSRSVSVTAAALALRDDDAVDEAIGVVRDARPVANPHPALVEQAVRYVGANR